MKTCTVDVLIVGGGPAGLACGAELARSGLQVLIAEREPEAGGVPRHTGHTGFGVRDLWRVMRGPQYAAYYAHLAIQAGVTLQTETTATRWCGPTSIQLTGPQGLQQISARAVVLATGCRERPRAARLVPGTRPQGVLTTGQLQQMVYVHHLPVGRRAVIVGAEHVSFTVVQTLIEAGVRPIALLTPHDHHQSYWPLKLMTADRHRVPVRTHTEIAAIHGLSRVTGIDIIDTKNSQSDYLACDTVIFTADWIPDNEFARAGGLTMDPGTLGPAVDTAYRTSRRGVFACGNGVHGAEASDQVTGFGRQAARCVMRFLADGTWPHDMPIQIQVAPPLAWCSPNTISTPPAYGSTVLLLRAARPLANTRIEIRQGERLLWQSGRQHLRTSVSMRIPTGWLRNVDRDTKTIHINASGPSGA